MASPGLAAAVLSLHGERRPTEGFCVATANAPPLERYSSERPVTLRFPTTVEVAYTPCKVWAKIPVFVTNCNFQGQEIEMR